jgi:hypothetical protein
MTETHSETISSGESEGQPSLVPALTPKKQTCRIKLLIDVDRQIDNKRLKGQLSINKNSATPLLLCANYAQKTLLGALRQIKTNFRV